MTIHQASKRPEPGSHETGTTVMDMLDRGRGNILRADEGMTGEKVNREGMDELCLGHVLYVLTVDSS